MNDDFGQGKVAGDNLFIRKDIAKKTIDRLKKITEMFENGDASKYRTSKVLINEDKPNIKITKDTDGTITRKEI